MREHGVLAGLLRVLAGRDPAVRPDAVRVGDLEWVVGAGLGPIVWHLTSRNQLNVPDAWCEPLQAADLVARLEVWELIRTTEAVIADLRGLGVDVTVLKGVSVATRYYQEPHLRMMGDADLLIPRPAIDDAVQMLCKQGYRLSRFAQPDWWDSHHHAPPLIHPESGVTIELHHGLLPPNAAAASDPAFAISTLEDRLIPGRLGAERVLRLRPECELALLAAAWVNDLSIFLGNPGMLRPLVDAALLLSRTYDTLDWDLVLRWAERTATGTGLTVLFGALKRYEALPIDRTVWERLCRASPVGTVATRVIHRFVDAHIVAGRPFGRVLSQHNTTDMIRTLLKQQPWWRRWPAVPFNLVFPPSHARRFDIGFQVRRLRSLLRPQ